MNAFSSMEIESRVSGAVRQGSDLLRGSGVLARLRAVAARAPFVFYMTAVTVAAAIYFFILAAPIYRAEAKFSIQGRQAPSPMSLLAAVSGGGGSAAAASGPVLMDYVKSSAMLATLDRQLHLRDLYTRFRPDFFHHLPARAPQRAFVNFYNNMVTIDMDATSGVMTLRVNSFDPQSAYATAALVLKSSEAMINNMSTQAQKETTRAAQRDFDRARAEAFKARLAVTNFQQRSGSLDPNSYGSAAGGAIFAIEANITQLRSQLASLMTYSTGSAPQVTQLRAQITNLQQQEAQLKQKLVGQNNGSAVSSQLNTFQGLSIALAYADQRLTMVQAVLDQAKSTAAQQQQFIVPISGPGVPDSPMPRAWWGLLTVMGVAAFLYMVGAFAFASIQDHRM